MGKEGGFRISMGLGRAADFAEKNHALLSKLCVLHFQTLKLEILISNGINLTDPLG